MATSIGSHAGNVPSVPGNSPICIRPPLSSELMGTHQFSSATVKFEAADQPHHVPGRSHDLSALVVEDPPVAHDVPRTLVAMISPPGVTRFCRAANGR